MKIDWEKILIKELAAIVAKALAKHNIDAILVGGACVSIYTAQNFSLMILILFPMHQ